MKTELKYRTFEELLDSVKVDLTTQDLEGSIDPAQLIKIAAKVSYSLGLKINPSRSKMLEINDGKARLPADFDVLNFALLCGDKIFDNYPSGAFPQYKTYCQGVVDGTETMQDVMMATMGNTLYTETLDIVEGANQIEHCLDTMDFIVQVFDPDGNLVDFIVDIISPDIINIISEVPSTLSDMKVVIVRGFDNDMFTSLFNELNICDTGSITPSCSNTCVNITETDNCDVIVSCETKDKSYSFAYHNLIPLNIVKAKTTSAESFNVVTRARPSVMLKNNFLVTNFKSGDVYINYKSLMEDDDGNMLVLSHPMIDEYYEYSIKQRIYENLYLSGKQSVGNLLQLVEAKLREARILALSIVNTPDFRELKEMWEINRKAQYAKYYNMFKSINPSRYNY